MLCFRKLTNFNKSFGSVRWTSSVKREFKEVEIKVPWGHVAGKWWEPYDTRPILTIHGWQDNCNTFDRLIPTLDKTVGFLAIDLPGQGYSSRLPPGMIYHYSNFILTVRSITKSFHWPAVSLMGHSLGSILSYVYSMLYPSEIDFLICLDAMKPMITSNKHIHMAKALDQFFKYNDYAIDSKEPPCYSIEEMRELISKPNDNSILPEYTTYIMDRNIAPSKVQPGKYYFTRDPRIKTGGLISFCQEEMVKLAENMKMPIFVMKASESSYYEKKEKYYQVLDVLKKASIDCDFHYVEGRHHLHLNNPEKISSLLNDFIQRHNVQDRSIGGIKEDIIRDFRPIFIEHTCKEVS
ncbi:unnamed protein product [Psylliodes chrysocephalus]|uniref:AB hydrolase-1 domain-containing protein n=1 Tax=Psylliodes chrysocephalus TaxID=3402493 RepID=A0A9P0D7Y3_9CUCU|nr:unnamed protein product [Psylliodes chrysocephala]